SPHRARRHPAQADRGESTRFAASARRLPLPPALPLPAGGLLPRRSPLPEPGTGSSVRLPLRRTRALCPPGTGRGGRGGAAMTATGAAPLLEVRGLVKHYPLKQGLFDKLRGEAPYAIRAVDGVDFSIARGQTLALVGESGCGKTTTG